LNDSLDAPAGTTTLARLETDAATARWLSELLEESLDPGAAAVAAFEAPEGGWRIEIHFATPPDEAGIRELVASADRRVAETLVFETIAPRDWVAASLADLKPVHAGRFVIHGAHDRAAVPANRIGIEIEAALAFGTGHHGTTLGCLLALDRLLRGRSPGRVLDVGTGTGVLAIAAARALRRPVLASDIDARAVALARQNAQANRVGSLVEVVCAPGVTDRRLRRRAPFELVLANILLEPLERLARPISGVAAPRAQLVLSGLLPEQANAALAAYRACGFSLERRTVLDGWATLVLRRRRQRPRQGPGQEPRQGPRRRRD
jgi:ribosomal protein L11 methyltransferase